MNKICTKCGIEKPVADFSLQSGNPRSECKSCTSARNAESYKGEKRQKRLASNRKHKLENPEYYSNYHKNYYQNNRAALLQASKDRMETVHFRAKHMHNSARKRAEEMQIPFDLSLERIIAALERGKCERTGIDFDLKSVEDTWRNPHAPSLDRIDSFQGYITANIQVVVTMYNYGKGQHKDSEFIEFCRRVVEYNS